MFLRFILCLLVICGSQAQTATTGDEGYRYKDGKCVNAGGREGLNYNYFGQCSDFRNLLIGRFDLHGLDLSGSRFEGADLQGTNLAGTTMVGVNFESAKISGVDFTDAKLTNSNFRSAALKNVKFGGALLNKIDFDTAAFSNVILSYFVCTECSLKNASFENIELDQAVLSKSDLSGAKLRGANLESAQLQEANLTGADLENSILTKTNFTSAVLIGASLKAAKGLAANFRDANLSQVNLNSANFSTADFSEAILAAAVYNKHTLLPFTREQAEKMGMSFQDISAVLVWTAYAESYQLSTLLISLGKISEGIELTQSTETDPELLKKQIMASDLVIFPRLGDPVEDSLIKALISPISYYLNEGGVLLSIAYDFELVLNLGILKTAGFIYTGESAKILWPDHRLMKGLGQNIPCQAGFGILFVQDDKATTLASFDDQPLVVTKPIGKGQVIWAGFPFFGYDANADKFLLNVIESL